MAKCSKCGATFDDCFNGSENICFPCLEKIPAGRRVKATDPRKKEVVAQLKQASGGTKVTNIKDLGDGRFQGNCLAFQGKGYSDMGTFIVIL